MSGKTQIEWTQATWNPIRGCTRVSEGCRHCYAERTAMRFSGPGQPYDGLVRITNGHPQWTGKVAFVEKHLEDPLHWKQPRRVFVNSMSDLFHEAIPDEWIDKIFAVMALCPQHTFQVLTKRPQRMQKYFTSSAAVWVMANEPGEPVPGERRDDVTSAMFSMFEERELFTDGQMLIQEERWPLPNVWLGVSVENQAAADERIPLLLQTPAALRWISAEPLLGPIVLHEFEQPEVNVDWLRGFDGGDPPIPGLDWVVVGGESGPGARPMHPDWARSLRDQCATTSVPFFFKQWGEHAPVRMLQKSHPIMSRVGKRAAGRLLDGREHNEYPATQMSAEARWA